MRKVSKILLVCLFIWSFLAFETINREDFSLSPDGKSHKNNPETCDSLIKFAKRYLDKPYCYGSRPPSCFDCSGFTAFVFDHFNTPLPHSSGSMAFLGKFISFKNASPGDLVFFNGRASGNETIGHVGIVTEFRDGKIFFIHASVQAGVIISDSEEAYYKKKVYVCEKNQALIQPCGQGCLSSNEYVDDYRTGVSLSQSLRSWDR